MIGLLIAGGIGTPQHYQSQWSNTWENTTSSGYTETNQQPRELRRETSPSDIGTQLSRTQLFSKSARLDTGCTYRRLIRWKAVDVCSFDVLIKVWWHTLVDRNFLSGKDAFPLTLEKQPAISLLDQFVILVARIRVKLG